MKQNKPPSQEKEASSQTDKEQRSERQTSYEAQTEAWSINLQNQDSIQMTEQDQGQPHYGKLIPLIKNQFDQPKFVLGPHYFIFIPTVLICTWFLKYCLETFYTKLYFDTLPMIFCFLASLFFIISYIRVGFSDPGIASKRILPSFGIRLERAYCRPCKVLRTHQTRHCYYCDVCILEMDHHCVWVGKCIGKNNWNLFKIFLFSVILNLVVFAICIIVSAKSAKLQLN